MPFEIADEKLNIRRCNTHRPVVLWPITDMVQGRLKTGRQKNGEQTLFINSYDLRTDFISENTGRSDGDKRELTKHINKNKYRYLLYYREALKMSCEP